MNELLGKVGGWVDGLVGGWVGGWETYLASLDSSVRGSRESHSLVERKALVELGVACWCVVGGWVGGWTGEYRKKREEGVGGWVGGWATYP